ncbi:MAG: hypothetical protein MSC31_05320 [Solirubrobacteraceae bacterium MAG38_C4-C5]|nr:hypothetical protein [Candidatus Siliceabacter maunaloa]
MTNKQFSALLGFLFVAVWVAENVGYALLCLVGATVFGAIGAIVEGELDLGELQGRLRRDRSGVTSGQGARSPRAQSGGPRVR